MRDQDPAAAGAAKSTSPPRIALIGLSGSGKTTTAPLLAERLGWPHVDLDRRVEETAGRTVSEIFASGAEPLFRDLERRALIQTAGEPGPCVLAAGGGIVLDPGNRRTLRDGFLIVWLRISVAEAARRLNHANDRPLLAGPDRIQGLSRLLDAREGLYGSVADFTLDTGPETPPEAVVDRLCAWVEAGCPLERK